MSAAPTFSLVSAAGVTRVLDRDVPAAKALVERVYVQAAAGGVVNPPSLFLRPEGGRPERFIALPAALAEPSPAVGIKWIGSFPGNLDAGLPRASAVIVLNDPATGFPIACLEGAVISATRTALSAVVGAETLAGRRQTRRLAVIGAGVISRRTVEMLLATGWQIGEIAVYDPRPDQAERLVQTLADVGAGTGASKAGAGGLPAPSLPTGAWELGGGEPCLPAPSLPTGAWELGGGEARLPAPSPPTVAGKPEAGVAGRVMRSAQEAVAGADVVLIATTAATPWFGDPALIRPGVTVLHLSLRDLTAETMAACDHVVDDPTHAAREGTSLELAIRQAGLNPDAARPIGALLSGAAPPRDPGRSVIYSPFGLGSLDVALARFVLERAREQGLTLEVPDFFGLSTAGATGARP